MQKRKRKKKDRKILLVPIGQAEKLPYVIPSKKGKTFYGDHTF